MPTPPTVILRFREDRIGVVADIQKAFQMIKVTEKDKDYLRWENPIKILPPLWWEDPIKRTVKVYRHRRVVFGVNCRPSPFMFAASCI